MAKAAVVHKRRYDAMFRVYLWEPKCDESSKMVNLTLFWRNVTCKRCLAKRGKR